jgi:hypothetical protein
MEGGWSFMGHGISNYLRHKIGRQEVPEPSERITAERAQPNEEGTLIRPS